MKKFYVKSASDGASDGGRPYEVSADSHFLAAGVLARNFAPGAVLYVWSEREWQERESPREYDVIDEQGHIE